MRYMLRVCALSLVWMAAIHGSWLSRWWYRTPMMSLGQYNFSRSELEVLEDEQGLYERWRAHSTEEPVMFYSQSEDTSNEHIARRGLLITRANARATILIMHGYTVSKVDMGILRLLFSPYNLLLFDFRAHGEATEGQSSTLGCDEVYDVFAAVDFLRSHATTKDLPIIAYGFSMGAVATIEAQSRDPELFSALVLDCPFDSTKELIKRGLDKALGQIHIPLLGIECAFPGRDFIERHAMDPWMQPFLFFLLRIFAGMNSSLVPTVPKYVDAVASARNIKVPVFLIGCYADERVPVDAFVRIYLNCAGYKRLWITAGARHYGSLFNNPELYQQMVANFIEKVLASITKRERQQRVITGVSLADVERMQQHLFDYTLSKKMVDVLYPVTQHSRA